MGNLSCDAVIMETRNRIVEDIGCYTGVAIERLKSFSAREIRTMVYPNYLYSDVSAYTVKCLRQISQMCDRYRFTEDTLDDNDLAKVAYDKFMQTQLRICSPSVTKLSTYKVVQRARTLCKEILGELPSDDEIFRHGSFSKRATAGSSLRESYFHKKLGLITGSRQHISWLKDQIKDEDLLKRVIDSQNGRYQEVSALNVSFVPKSWKTFRTVTPNSLIGSYWSYGVGSIIRRKLKDIGLDIRYLQTRQQKFAKHASLKGHLVTADLSAASDSFTGAFLNRILPRSWYCLLKHGRIGHVRIKNPHSNRFENSYLQSFMAMGIGYTFPVQTLVFYSLIRAISELTGVRGTVSVYGDDLIYPVEIHDEVVSVFSDCHFILNQDKSFARGNFRESCGGDFYRGVDVRPSMVDFHHTHHTELEWLSCIYKLYNSLKARWDECELPSTFRYLEDLVVKVFGRCHVIPPYFPDSAGFKFAEVPVRMLDKVRLTRGKSTSWYLTFNCLSTTVPGLRILPEEQYPYLWLKLSTLEDPSKDELWASKSSQAWLNFEKGDTSIRQTTTDILYWRTTRITVRGRKVRRLRAFTSYKSKYETKEVSQSVTDWT